MYLTEYNYTGLTGNKIQERLENRRIVELVQLDGSYMETFGGPWRNGMHQLLELSKMKKERFASLNIFSSRCAYGAGCPAWYMQSF
jgi:hypothetical protein